VQLEHRHLDRHGDGWEGARDGVAAPDGWASTSAATPTSSETSRRAPEAAPAGALRTTHQLRRVESGVHAPAVAFPHARRQPGFRGGSRDTACGPGRARRDGAMQRFLPTERTFVPQIQCRWAGSGVWQLGLVAERDDVLG
jgi:hypothetical protein